MSFGDDTLDPSNNSYVIAEGKICPVNSPCDMVGILDENCNAQSNKAIFKKLLLPIGFQAKRYRLILEEIND